MRTSLTHAVEDYLKTIYELTADNQRVSTNLIAERLGITPASVTGMIQKLAGANPPLLEYRKHHGVELTPEGEKVALEIIRHHRLLELFLHETLGYSWDEVHAEAELLEHVISEDFEERIAQALGDPSHDPHGEPIPTRDFRLPPQSKTRLSELRSGDQASVQRVDNTDPNFLRYLTSIGLTPQARLEILGHSPFDDNLRLQVQGQAQPIVLGLRVTRQVYVNHSEWRGRK